MIRALLARLLTPANPARDLAKMQHQQHRERVKEKARELRASMGLPPLQILNTKGN